jgi:hypothetical protein
MPISDTNVLIDLFILGSGFGVSATSISGEGPRHVHDSSAIHFFELPPAFSTSIEPVVHIVPSMATKVGTASQSIISGQNRLRIGIMSK